MTDTSVTSDRPTAGMRWKAPIVLGVVMFAVAVSNTLLRRDPSPKPPPAGQRTKITILVGPHDYARDADDYQVDWRQGLTVFAALETAVGGEQVDRTGQGVNTFVNSINQLENEGPGGRNWQYYINGERGQVSAGVETVQPGDRILWELAPYE